MKSPSGLPLFEPLSGSRECITSQPSHMWSASVSQWQGFVPMTSSSISVRPSPSKSGLKSSTVVSSSTHGSKRLSTSSALISMPRTMSFGLKRSKTKSCPSLFLPRSAPLPPLLAAGAQTLAWYQKKYSQPSGMPSTSVSESVGSMRGWVPECGSGLQKPRSKPSASVQSRLFSSLKAALYAACSASLKLTSLRVRVVSLRPWWKPRISRRLLSG